MESGRVKSSFNISAGAINMNSLNVSTLGSRNSKTLLKIDAITRGRHEVLFMSDCGLDSETDDVARVYRGSGLYSPKWNLDA